jgi:hypothetical protein
MLLKMHKIISAKVLPEQAGGGFGEFDDGWLEALPPDERRSRAAGCARRRERTCPASKIDVAASC